MRFLLLISTALLLVTAPVCGQGRPPLQDALFDFDDPFDDDVQNGMIRYNKALELCELGYIPADPAPKGLQQISTGGQGISPNGSAEILPDSSPGRACCGATDWLSGRVFYDLKWDDILYFKAAIYYEPPAGRPQVEGIPASFKFESLWLDGIPTSDGLLEVVTTEPGQIAIRDSSGFINGILTRNDFHWYTFDFTLTMPSGPGQNATMSVDFADMGMNGDLLNGFVTVGFAFPADGLEAAHCVMPFATFRHWAGTSRIDNLEMSSTVFRSSFESGDLGSILTQ